MTSMKSTVMKRSIMDFGRRTSISLDEPFLSALKACGFESPSAPPPASLHRDDNLMTI